jgi:hypothetical protein
VQTHDLASQGQSQSGAGDLLDARIFRAIEPLEDALGVVGTDADPAVAHREPTVLTTNLTLMSNRALRMMFARAADGLPLATAALAQGAHTKLPPRSGRVDFI